MPTARERRDDLRSNFWRRKLAPAILDRDGWVCHICGKPIEYVVVGGRRMSRHKSPHPMSASVDHIRGASTGYDQRFLRAAHRVCNQKRGDPTRNTEHDPRPKVMTTW